jgi:hypothetical protein
MTFTHPYSKRRCNIQRTQVPIVPAFAMTVHKAQGQTMDNVIVDLQGCDGTESAYVMISWVTSLQGLLILRPFEKKKIQCNMSEDTRKEFRRLHILNLHSLMEYGNEDDRNKAKLELDSIPQSSLPYELENIRFTDMSPTTASIVFSHPQSPILQPANRK